MLKFYFKETRLPCSLPPRGIYSSSYKDVREMQMLGPGQSFAYKVSQPTGSFLHSRSYAPPHCTASASFAGIPLARANTIGGEVPLRTLPSFDLPGAVGNFAVQPVVHGSATGSFTTSTSYTLQRLPSLSSLGTSNSTCMVGTPGRLALMNSSTPIRVKEPVTIHCSTLLLRVEWENCFVLCPISSAYPLRRLHTDGSLLQHRNVIYQSPFVREEATALQRIGVCNPFVS